MTIASDALAVVLGGFFVIAVSARVAPVWAEEESAAEEPVIIEPPETSPDSVEPVAAPASVVWLNHLDLRPSQDEVRTTFGGTSTGIPAEPTGLVLQSITTGERYTDGEPKEVRLATGAPLGLNVVGVRICYALSNARSFISQVRLAQLEQAGSQAVASIDDGADLIAEGPICIDSAGAPLDPQLGPLLLTLRLSFGNTGDRITIRGLGLLVEPVQ